MIILSCKGHEQRICGKAQDAFGIDAPRWLGGFNRQRTFVCDYHDSAAKIKEHLKGIKNKGTILVIDKLCWAPSARRLVCEAYKIIISILMDRFERNRIPSFVIVEYGYEDVDDEESDT